MFGHWPTHIYVVSKNYADNSDASKYCFTFTGGLQTHWILTRIMMPVFLRQP